MTMTRHDRNASTDIENPWALTHPDQPLIDDHTAAVVEEAAVELTLLRSPMALGDCLADLHAMVSLLAQLRAWIPLSVAGARHQGHSWAAIAAQFGVTPATAIRRHRSCIDACAQTPEGPTRFSESRAGRH